MKLNETTFGDTPAAMYLARELINNDNSVITKSVSRRIVTTKTHVASLVAAYQSGFLAPKTMANSLRLMREEITNQELSDTADVFIYKLCRNVQIGAIKQAMRLAYVARKAETRMSDYKHKTSVDENSDLVWHDNQSNKFFRCGQLIDNKPVLRTFSLNEVSDVNSELLHERSVRRCERRGVSMPKYG